MNKKLNYLIFICRIQPPHKAHIEIIRRALDQAETVIILIGSSNQPRTIKNPWKWKERADMIKDCFSYEDRERLRFAGVSDNYSNQGWARDVQNNVDKIISRDIKTTPITDFLNIEFAPSIGLIGHKKDDSSFYLDMFPQWKFVEVESIGDIHSTDIRNQMFELVQLDKSLIPPPIVDYLEAFMNSDAFDVLKEEYDFITKYRQSWAAAPYPPTFVTADAIVVQSGHVLLVKRRSCPGKNLWAAVGGFVNPSEYIKDAVIRELKEETKIKIPAPVLKGSITKERVYDAPSRSLRGRTITHAFLFELPEGPLPKVKGSDDAIKAKWVPLATLARMEDQLFEDHYLIISDMLGGL